MKKTLLVLLGYGIGLGGLVLITYRTLLAVGTESKAIMISVNQFGEQYLDLVCLVFLWGVSVIGLLSLSSLLQNEKKVFDEGRNERNVGMKYGITYSDSLEFLGESAGVVVGELGQSLSKTSSGFFRLDEDETDSDFSYSVHVVQEGKEK